MSYIKFRAWDNEKGWFFDCLQSIHFDTEIGVTVLSTLDEMTIWGTRVVLEQYVGIRDRADKECFCNDIVKTREGLSLVRSWIGNTWIEGITWIGLILLSDRYSEFEIVGNIHENPELLK